jgi:aspartyl protease family protein
MSEQEPWRTPEPEGSPRGQFLLWLALIGAGALGIWALWRMFPNALSDVGDQGYFLQLCVLLVLIASAGATRRFSAREALRNIAIWVGVVAVLMVGYTSYHRFQDAVLDARSELVPGYPAEIDASRMVLSENRDGDFTAIGTVNGTTVEFIIDTGASDIVLSPADARRAGIDVDALHFNRMYETANGEGRGAPYVVDRLEIGPVKLVEVPVSINASPMRASLLGMSFLKRMKSFEMKGRKLTLRWR